MRPVEEKLLTLCPNCRSLVANLDAEAPPRVQDKRLQKQLNAMRQLIFNDDGRRTSDVYPQRGDRVDWIATATQAADCLIKNMKSTCLLQILDTCKYQVSREGNRKPEASSSVESDSKTVGHRQRPSQHNPRS